MIISKPGRPGRGGGTWGHPQVGYHFAQWCSPAFAVQVTEWIHDIKRQGYATATGVSLNTEPPPKAAKPRLPSPNAVFRDYMRTMKMIGFSASEAALAANRATVADTGKDILETAGVKALSAPAGSPHLSPSDIGAELASLTGGAVLSGQKVNSLLMRYGFQEKGATKATPWVPTEKGDPFKEWTVTGKKHRDGSSVNWLRWKADIVPALVAAMSATPSTDTTIQH
ncbi:KilA-N domain-containing protein [Azospirillum oryzae]|uniref:KilA-N domain-containing protein n=1 Tax=Azospirillum oryzae TaxID=286727 RepID=A0A1X7HQ63_9PROT|nr:KilA-N domain-containing protein [Azospirillum oryzae]